MGSSYFMATSFKSWFNYDVGYICWFSDDCL